MNAKTPKAPKAAKSNAAFAPPGAAPADLSPRPPVFEMIALDRLSLAPENARFGKAYEPEGIKALAGSIAADRVQQPLSVYRDGDAWQVWDGGRRLAALQLLASQKALPATLAAGVPCLVDTDATAARLRSLTTFVRENMHPADEFLAYKAAFDAGLDPNQIAAACAVTAPRVRQLLRLNAAAPEVIEALRENRIALDVAEAFTLTDDLDRQRDILTGMKPNTTAWAVKSALRSGSIAANAELALFVGRDAYLEAGGTILTDLFSREGDAFSDGALVRRLAEDKMLAIDAQLREEGWAWVRRVDYSYEVGQGCRRATSAIGDGEEVWTSDLKARAGVFVHLDRQGQAQLSRGWEEAKARQEKPAPKTAAATDPARFGFGHGGHAKLTMIATQATRVALVRKPEAAYDALLTTLAWGAFRKPQYGAVTETNASRLSVDPVHNMPAVTVEGMDEMDRLRARWNGVLPTGRVAFCDYVAGLSAADKAELLAICFADTIHAGEAKNDGYDRKPTRWRHLGWMANHAGADVAGAWTPDAEFLKGASKDALTDAIKTTPEAAEGNWSTAKKKELVTYAAGLAERHGWRPKLLAEFADPAAFADPEPPPPQAAGATREFDEDVFVQLLVTNFQEMGVEMDEDALEAQARKCLRANQEQATEDGEPLLLTEEEATAMAELWDCHGDDD